MIVELLFALVTTIVDTLLGLLPVWTPVDLSGLAANLNSGPAGSVFQGLAWANWYLPIEEMLAAAALLLSIQVGTHVVRLIIWVLQLFHVAGGGGTS